MPGAAAPPLGAARALLIDAGFTLVSYDGVTVADLAAEVGVSVDARAVEATEPGLRAELAHHDWPQSPGSAAPITGGARFFRRVLELAGAQPTARARDSDPLSAAAELIWDRHLGENIWSRLYEGIVPALRTLHQHGLRLALVSNSEGTVEALMAKLELSRYFDAVIDSWHVGVTKPDPAIFRHALERLGVAPQEAIMVGDSMKADVGGAVAAGVPAVLIDPFDLHRDAEVTRYPTFVTFAEAVLAAQRGGS